MCRECYTEQSRTNGGRFPSMRRRVYREHATRKREQPPAPANLLEAPMEHLWFETDRVFAFIKEEAGDTARMELSKVPGMASRWDGWRGRPFVRFDHADELLCVLGLWIGDLGDPHFSGSGKHYPILEAV